MIFPACVNGRLCVRHNMDRNANLSSGGLNVKGPVRALKVI